MTTLEISATVKFDSVVEARIAGQAIEQFLGIKGKNAVRLIASADGSNFGRKTLPLYPASQNTDGFTRGKQDMESRVMTLAKNIHINIPALPVDANLTENVLILEGKQWGVNFQQLFDNVAVHADKNEVKEAFNAAVALTLQQEVLRGVK